MLCVGGTRFWSAYKASFAQAPGWERMSRFMFDFLHKAQSIYVALATIVAVVFECGVGVRGKHLFPAERDIVLRRA